MKNSILMLFWTFSCCFCDGDVLICRGVLCSVCVCVGASVDIDLEVFVNHSTAPGLNSGQQQLEDILILHLERGKDYFISITGSYLPSCFGSSLSTLCLLRAPIQDMNLDTIRDLVRPSFFTKVIFVWLRIVKSWCLGGIKPTSVLFVCSVRSWSQRAKRATPNLKISQRRSGWWWTISSVMPKNRSLYIFVMLPLSSPP